MLELRLAGIHDDGENLVLESADGTSYLLPIDQNLRQSIAKARRISPLRTGGSGVFGPRDIQTRFRQGATVEEISAESGWEPERVRRYEWPIIAERANIIHTARTAKISTTPGAEGTPQSLNQHIEQVAADYGFVDAPMDWTTWQQESGQWTVSVDIALNEASAQGLPRGVMFPARWNFNPANQSIYASNEAAYFLMGRDNNAPATPTTPATPAAEEAAPVSSQEEAAPAKLTAVRVPDNKEQNELLDELSARRGARSFDPASERKLADLLERARRGSRPAGAELGDVVEEGQEETALLTPSATEGEKIEAQAETETISAGEESNLDTTPAASAEAQETQPATSPQEEPEAEASTDSTPESEPETPQEAPEPATDTSAEESEGTEAPASNRTSRGKRTSVPSWDDIIFGNQRR